MATPYYSLVVTYYEDQQAKRHLMIAPQMSKLSLFAKVCEEFLSPEEQRQLCVRLLES